VQYGFRTLRYNERVRQVFTRTWTTRDRILQIRQRARCRTRCESQTEGDIDDDADNSSRRDGSSSFETIRAFLLEGKGTGCNSPEEVSSELSRLASNVAVISVQNILRKAVFAPQPTTQVLVVAGLRATHVVAARASLVRQTGLRTARD
jgi:hypothetical protein